MHYWLYISHINLGNVYISLPIEVNLGNIYMVFLTHSKLLYRPDERGERSAWSLLTGTPLAKLLYRPDERGEGSAWSLTRGPWPKGTPWPTTQVLAFNHYIP